MGPGRGTNVWPLEVELLAVEVDVEEELVDVADELLEELLEELLVVEEPHQFPDDVEPVCPPEEPDKPLEELTDKLPVDEVEDVLELSGSWHPNKSDPKPDSRNKCKYLIL
jgi:hypothetical protein